MYNGCCILFIFLNKECILRENLKCIIDWSDNKMFMEGYGL